MELIRANDTGEKSMAVKRSLFVGHAANKYIVKILTEYSTDISNMFAHLQNVHPLL